MERTIDIVELISGHDLGFCGGLHVSRIVRRALHDIAGPHGHGLGALLAGESEAANCALALATDGGISDDEGGVDELSASSAATSVAASFFRRWISAPPCWIYGARTVSNGASCAWCIC